MKQIYTILFDLDGTLVDTAPDLMMAHNHVMKKFGYQTKTTDEIRELVGQGAGTLIGRSIWGQAKKEFSKVQDQKIRDNMTKEYSSAKYFNKWCKRIFNLVQKSKNFNGSLYEQNRAFSYRSFKTNWNL